MFNSEIKEFFNGFGTHKNMVLSTSPDNKVHSRMMSIVCFDNKFYFQTDKSFKKCKDIEINPYVALCIDNIQIEGLCRTIGRPLDNIEFCEVFKASFSKAYELYTSLENEVLYEIEPVYIECWIYENNEPYIAAYDVINKQYSKKKYEVNFDAKFRDTQINA